MIEVCVFLLVVVLMGQFFTFAMMCRFYRTWRLVLDSCRKSTVPEA